MRKKWKNGRLISINFPILSRGICQRSFIIRDQKSTFYGHLIGRFCFIISINKTEHCDWLNIFRVTSLTAAAEILITCQISKIHLTQEKRCRCVPILINSNHDTRMFYTRFLRISIAFSKIPTHAIIVDTVVCTCLYRQKRPEKRRQKRYLSSALVCIGPSDTKY